MDFNCAQPSKKLRTAIPSGQHLYHPGIGAFSKDPSTLGDIGLPHSWVLSLKMSVKIEMHSMFSKRNYIVVGTIY